MKYLIGVDAGTSSMKTILMDENGKIRAQAVKEYALYEPANGWAEQDPLDWKNAAFETIAAVVQRSQVQKEDIAGIGLTGQMHGLVMLDEDNQPIGSDRLLYLPFLMGERTPHMEPDYRGAFVGLNSVHGQAHLLRAIMEGVAYCLADCNDILKRQGITVGSMGVCGGGSRSPVWQKIMANLFRCRLHTMKQEEGPAYGAAILAGVGAGIFPDVPGACARLTAEDQTIYWNESEAEQYQKFHRIYDAVYSHLRQDFSELAKLQERI